MLTREEALQITQQCRITSLGELAHGYVVYQATANEIINQLFDQQNELQQHIKELESRLSSNPLQLNCNTCEHRNFENYKKCGGGWCGTCYIGKTENNYTPKDKQ